MPESTSQSVEMRVESESKSALELILMDGAQKMLRSAVEAEVSAYIEGNSDAVDDRGRQLVVRNGSLPERTLVTGMGPMKVKQPRVNDKRPGERFTSAILPRYLRRVPSIDALIPCLYLKGISTGDFSEALEAILGKGAAGLSATNVVRLKEIWKEEFREWESRDLTGKRYVYFWADGIYFNVRLGDDRPCLLVIMGTLEDGTKELVAVHDGERESKLSWSEALRDLKRRGLKDAPKLCVGDGALGFWAAIREVFQEAREQRCWVHKKVNVINKMPRGSHVPAKKLLDEMHLSATKDQALQAFEEFHTQYGVKFPKACECLAKDKDALFTFYDFPAEHWSHIRTTNPIESTFATVRHRTKRTKGCGSRSATLTMVFKLAREAEKTWRRINGYHLIGKLIEGVQFKDGEEVLAA